MDLATEEDGAKRRTFLRGLMYPSFRHPISIKFRNRTSYMDIFLGDTKLIVKLWQRRSREDSNVVADPRAFLI